MADSYEDVPNTICIYAHRGMTIIRDAILESENWVSDIRPFDATDKKSFYSMDFTYGSLVGRIECYRIDFHRPRHDVYISGTRTLHDIAFMIQSKYHTDTMAEDILVEAIIGHLEYEQKKYIPKTKSTNKC
jgi:hypothetical protein